MMACCCCARPLIDGFQQTRRLWDEMLPVTTLQPLRHIADAARAEHAMVNDDIDMYKTAVMMACTEVRKTISRSSYGNVVAIPQFDLLFAEPITRLHCTHCSQRGKGAAAPLTGPTVPVARFPTRVDPLHCPPPAMVWVDGSAPPATGDGGGATKGCVAVDAATCMACQAAPLIGPHCTWPCEHVACTACLNAAVAVDGQRCPVCKRHFTHAVPVTVPRAASNVIVAVVAVDVFLIVLRLFWLLIGA